MGLASKIAAGAGTAAAQYAQGGNKPPGGYGAPQPAYQQGAPPQQSYGQPPQAYGQQANAGYYGGQPAPGGPRPVSGQYGQSQNYQQNVAPQQQPYYQQQSHGQLPPPGQHHTGPPQGQYGAPQGQYGAPQGQYGAPQQPQGYGAPPQGGGNNYQAILQSLQHCVNDQKLNAFYPPGSLEPIANRVNSSGCLDRISAEWKLPKEIAIDLVKLALFDTVILVDDSGSMAIEENGERIDDLKIILARCAYATSMFDQDGISVRFLNSPMDVDGINTEKGATDLVGRVRFSGLTPLGTSLDKKILQPHVLGPARSNSLQKPVLCICITDGQPAGESRDHVFKVIINASRELARTRYGSDAISLEFAQVGNDIKARQFLEEIDNHPEVGNLVDCSSNYELEADEMMKNSGVELTPELWLVKLLLGSVSSDYDFKDERRWKQAANYRLTH